MATAKTAAPAEKQEEKMVKIRLMKDNGRYSDDVFVAVNGRSFLIKRGVEVEVPECIYEALQHSMDQDNAAAELMANGG